MPFCLPLRWPLLTSSLGLALLLGPSAVAQSISPPTQKWDKTFGGSLEDRPTVVRATADGGFIIGGVSVSAAGGDKTDAGRGGQDYWIVKTDSSGVKQWDKTIGGTSDDRLERLEQTPDGGYILAGTSNSGAGADKTEAGQGNADFWVVKLDALGVKEWDRSVGSADNDNLGGVALTPDGGYILSGDTGPGISGDKTEQGQGGSDYWLIKLDSMGVKVWDKTYGGLTNETCKGVVPTADGGCLVGGLSYSGIGGDKTEDNRGTYDFWVVKTDSMGVKQWDKTVGGNGSDQLTNFAQTMDGGYMLAGFSDSGISGEKTEGVRGGFDMWVIKADSAGQRVWDHTFGANDYEQLNGMTELADGGFVFAAQSNSNAGGDKTEDNVGAQTGFDYWVVRTDSAGTKLWDKTIGGTDDDVPRSMCPTQSGGFVIVGQSKSDISGTKSQASRGGYDYWAVRIDSVVTVPPPTGLSASASLKQLAVYPNPAHAAAMVQLPAAAPHGPMRVRLFDALGRVVWEQTTAAAEGRLNLSFGNRLTGIYQLHVSGANGFVRTQRLLLE